MIIDYQTFRKQNNKELSDFMDKNIFFAFDNEQFEKGLEKVHATKDDIVSIGFGGFMTKEQQKAYKDLSNKQLQDLRNYMLNDYTQARKAFLFEMINHECMYSGDYEEVLEVLALTQDDLKNNRKLQQAFDYARKQCMKRAM